MCSFICIHVWKCTICCLRASFVWYFSAWSIIGQSSSKRVGENIMNKDKPVAASYRDRNHGRTRLQRRELRGGWNNIKRKGHALDSGVSTPKRSGGIFCFECRQRFSSVVWISLRTHSAWIENKSRINGVDGKCFLSACDYSICYETYIIVLLPGAGSPLMRMRQKGQVRNTTRHYLPLIKPMHVCSDESSGWNWWQGYGLSPLPNWNDGARIPLCLLSYCWQW